MRMRSARAGFATLARWPPNLRRSALRRRHFPAVTSGCALSAPLRTHFDSGRRPCQVGSAHESARPRAGTAHAGPTPSPRKSSGAATVSTRPDRKPRSGALLAHGAQSWRDGSVRRSHEAACADTSAPGSVHAAVPEAPIVSIGRVPDVQMSPEAHIPVTAGSELDGRTRCAIRDRASSGALTGFPNSHGAVHCRGRRRQR
jgi:hypothetical protein